MTPRSITTHGLAAFVMIAACAGCADSPYELAPVSGAVTLNGEPLANATVSYEPRGGPERSIVGPGSVGTTDAEGRYTLSTFKDEPGAVVGQHTVRISTFKSQFKDIKNSDAVEVVSEERVPWRYNRSTELVATVATGGTDQADFELTGAPPRKGRR
ncbi:MAG: hypothetical protein KDA44_03060 [Planctomycetales bacterium]|nr:hypothetical protein [Planctomycetales bacterium]